MSAESELSRCRAMVSEPVLSRGRFRVLLNALVLLAAVNPTLAPASQAANEGINEFCGRFSNIVDVGTCLDDPKGLFKRVQTTSKGLIVEKGFKEKISTAFTDGYHTWIIGPYGVQTRLNTERFEWEKQISPYPTRIEIGLNREEFVEKAKNLACEAAPKLCPTIKTTPTTITENPSVVVLMSGEKINVNPASYAYTIYDERDRPRIFIMSGVVDRDPIDTVADLLIHENINVQNAPQRKTMPSRDFCFMSETKALTEEVTAALWFNSDLETSYARNSHDSDLKVEVQLARQNNGVVPAEKLFNYLQECNNRS